MLAGQPSTVYSPANECIYCGDRDSPLGREHIIPLGLSGNLIIPRASCEKCAKITKQFERTCLRTMFGPYRVRLGFKTSRPKDRRKPYPLSLYDLKGRKSSISLPLSKHPATLAFPILEPPNILSGRPPPDPNLKFKFQIQIMGTESDFTSMRNIIAETKTDLVHMGSLNINAFARMVAKIGHSYAYAKTDGFQGTWRPLLKDTILGKFRSFHHFVGTDSNAPAEGEGEHHRDHQLTIGHRLTIGRIISNNVEYLSVLVRLFAYMDNTPTYLVIVAEKEDQPTQ